MPRSKQTTPVEQRPSSRNLRILKQLFAFLRPYRGARWYEVRETAATLVALWDVVRMQPAQIIGNPTPIN